MEPKLRTHSYNNKQMPIIRERRKFTDIMDEEIGDERRSRTASRYGTPDSMSIRRLRNEVGSRLQSYVEADSLMEATKGGHPPFFREKPQTLAITEGVSAHLSCFAVGDPRPNVLWFKNDQIIQETKRITFAYDLEGRSILQFTPASITDTGIYKVVARNRTGQTMAKARIVIATKPDAVSDYLSRHLKSF